MTAADTTAPNTIQRALLSLLLEGARAKATLITVSYFCPHSLTFSLSLCVCDRSRVAVALSLSPTPIVCAVEQKLFVAFVERLFVW